MSGSSDQQQPQAPAQPDLNAMIQALIQRQLAVASGQGQQVQLPPTPQAQTQYSNDPSQGPDLLARIGLAIGGGSLPGAPAELRQQMGKQALLNFGIGLLGAGRFSTPGEALAGGLSGAQRSLLGSEAAQAGQQEYALGSREKLAELGLTQQKNQTEALTSILPLIQMSGRLGLPPLFGPGSSAAGGPGGGAGGPAAAAGVPSNSFEGTMLDHEGRGPANTVVPEGYGGFLPSTWDAFAAANPTLFQGMSPAQIQAARNDPALAARAVTWLAQQNATTLSKNGIPPSGMSLGVAHFLGAGGASKVLAAPDTDPVSKYVSDAAVKANPQLGTMTVGDMKRMYANTPNPSFLGGPGGGGGTATAAPPATGPTGPYKGPGAATAAATPPAAGGGGPPSIGDVALPPAKGSAANVVPGLSAADAAAIAKQSGRDVPFGDQGMVAHADGTVGTGAKGSGGGISGKRADAGQVGQDVAAIQGGMQGASGGAPGGVLAAGPAAQAGSIGGALAPPTPGLAANVAAPVGPIRSPAVVAQPPPAQPPTPPPVSTQPPAAPAQPPALPVRPPDVTARNDDGTYTVPDEKLSVPQYQSRYRQAPTPDELVSRGLVLPENAKAFQDQQTAVQEAENSAQAAKTAANLAALPGYSGSYGTVAAVLKENIAAQAKAQDARNTYDAMVQDAAKTNAGALQKFYTDQDTQLAAAHKDILDRQAAVALEAQRQKGQIAQTDESQRIAYINSQQGKLDEEGQKSRENLWQLDMLGGLSEAAGSANPIGEMEIGGRSVRDWLLNSGIGTQSQVGQWKAQDAFKAGVTKFAQDMRAGQGMGRLTNQELTVMMQMLPNTGMDQGAREAIMDYMRQLYQRKSDFALHTANHLTDTDQNGRPISFSGAMNAADTELGPILQTVPKESSGSIAARDQWLKDTLRPNTLFRQPNGTMAIYRGEAPAGGQ